MHSWPCIPAVRLRWAHSHLQFCCQQWVDPMQTQSSLGISRACLAGCLRKVCLNMPISLARCFCYAEAVVIHVVVRACDVDHRLPCCTWPDKCFPAAATAGATHLDLNGGGVHQQGLPAIVWWWFESRWHSTQYAPLVYPNSEVEVDIHSCLVPILNQDTQPFKRLTTNQQKHFPQALLADNTLLDSTYALTNLALLNALTALRWFSRDK